MNIIRTSVNGLSTLGAFGVATDRFAIISEIWPEKSVDAIKKALEVPVIKTNLADTALVGILSAANSNGIVLPRITNDRDINNIKEALDDDLKIGIVSSNITCLGNCVLANKNGAIVHEKLEASTISVIKDTLDVDVEKGNIIRSPLVGSHALATDRGVISHPLTTEMELTWLSEELGVPANVGTINRGTPYVSVGFFANSRGAIAGKDTTGPELQRLFQTLKGM